MLFLYWKLCHLKRRCNEFTIMEKGAKQVKVPGYKGKEKNG